MNLNNQSNTVKRLFIAGFILTIVLITFVVLPMVIKYENNLEKTRFKPVSRDMQLSDTLRISVDLSDNENINKFIEKTYPNYKILEHKHISSDFSQEDGVHKIYSLILVKK